jgi:hypothetical protein
MKNYKQAINKLTEALQMSESIRGKDDVRLVAILNDLGVAYN